MDASDDGRGEVVGIAEAQRWPCVGDPAGWDKAGRWFTCGAQGSLSVLGVVPADRMMEADGDHPVLVHVTVCRPHLKVVKRWLREFQLPEDDVVVGATQYIMDHYQTVIGDLEVEVFAPVAM